MSAIKIATKHSLVLTVSIVMLCLIPFGAAHAESKSINMIDYVSDDKTVSQTKLNSADVALKRIVINQALKDALAGDAVDVALPDGQTLLVRVTQNKVLANGDKLLIGNDENANQLLLTIGATASYGSIYGDEVRYSIGHESTTGAFIIDESRAERPLIDLGNDGITPPNRNPSTYTRPTVEELAERAAKAAKPGDSIITLLAVYSPEFARGFSSPESRINQMIAFTNASFTRSNIDIELQLANAVQLNFNNNTDNSTLLDQATFGGGAFSSVEQIRNEVGADMVSIMTFQPGNSASGIAWVNGDQDRFAYSVVQLSPGCCDVIFTHEIGHNLGSGHERQSANPGAPSPCDSNFTGYSCGHGRPGEWGTIMSRLDRVAVNFTFSNPGLTCVGAPCGIPEGQSNSADNFRSFSISGPLIANFRQSSTPPTDPTPPAGPPSTPNGTIPIPAIIPLLLDEQE